MNREAEIDPEICKSCHFAKRSGLNNILGCAFWGDLFPSGNLYKYELINLLDKVKSSHGKRPAFNCPKGFSGFDVPIVLSLPSA